PTRSTPFPYTTLFRSDRLIVSAAKNFGHHFARARAHDNAIAAPHSGAWLHDDDIAGAIRRLHGIAGDLERIDAILSKIGKAHGLDRKSTRLNSSHVKI